MPATATASLNNVPVLDVIGDRAVDENEMLQFTLSATDHDDEDLFFSGSNLPSGSSLNNSTGYFEWTPSYENAGTYLVQFVVSDGAYIDSEYITITVHNVNRPPVLPPLPDISINETDRIQFVLDATDPDDDHLVLSKDVSMGRIEENVFTWTPSYDDQGEHMITFSVGDGSLSETQTMVINVSNVNRDPVLYSIGDTTAFQHEAVTIELNAFDPDGDKLHYSNITVLPEGVTLDHDTGVLQWPDPDTMGVFFWTFSVNDGSASSTKSTTVVIGDSNSPPVINSTGPYHTDENSELSFQISAHDEDPDDVLIYSASGLPSGASFDTNTRLFSWTPSYEQAGNYSVEFAVLDDSRYKYADYEVVDITVSDLNLAPVIDHVDEHSVIEKDTIYVNLSGSDPDNDELFFSTNSSYGEVRGNSFIWTPDYSDAGVHNFIFTVSDGSLNNSTTSMIIVNDTNMAPFIDPLAPLEVIVNRTLEFNVSVNDGDADDILTYSGLDIPSGAELNSSTGLFSWKPSEDQNGKYSVGFRVTDGISEDYETISITVKEPSSTSSEYTRTSSGGGGGGGGSQNTGEDYENIEFKDYSIKYVMKDKETVFNFKEQANNIISISFVSRLNAGQTKAMVEILKGTSTLVKSAPSGNVYRNLNIWVGDSKFPSDTIDDVIISFRVERAWIISNDLDPGSVKMHRYSNGEWESLRTSMTGEDGDHFYYESETPGFSPFSILVPNAEISGPVLMEDNSSQNMTKMSIAEESLPVGEKEVTQDSNRSLVLVFIIGIIAATGVLGLKYRSHYEKLYMQIGNPDGKRYRRLKK